ncbi:MAG: ferritin [Synergistaceae bacterium]|jgi:ferritin|nr:ferritin [Synergistaceae bacterium]
MLKERVLKALSNQVNAEFYSAYLYLGMSAFADRAGYKGVANWLYVQSQEEMAHAVHIYKHILERGEAPSFADIKAPQASYDSVKEVFERVLAHEKHVSGLIDNIATIAMEERDHATYNFLAWFVAEQVEEESSAEELVSKVKLIGDNPALLYDLDTALAARTFTDPFPPAAAD